MSGSQSSPLRAKPWKDETPLAFPPASSGVKTVYYNSPNWYQSQTSDELGEEKKKKEKKEKKRKETAHSFVVKKDSIPAYERV